MRLIVTGGTGLVGRFIVAAALSRGWKVTVMSRRKPADGAFPAPVEWFRLDLDDAAQDLPPGHDALVHAAFDHLPGRYRGGEGDDPAGFLRRNLDASVRLFERARARGVARVVFLSSRAIFGGYPAGTRLAEYLSPRPDTLYGRVKAEAEQELAALSGPDLTGCSLRATGIYGPARAGLPHKWTDLFRNWQAGGMTRPRVATEVHGADLADAVLRVLTADRPPQVAHVSDLMLDRHDLLAEAARIIGPAGPLPPRADAARVSALDCARLRALGWTPGGMDRLRKDLPGLLAEAGCGPTPAWQP